MITAQKRSSNPTISSRQQVPASDDVTTAGRRKLTRTSAAAGEPEKPPLSKEDRWAAIARAVAADDAEADSEDFKVHQTLTLASKPEALKPPICSPDLGRAVVLQP